MFFVKTHAETVLIVVYKRSGISTFVLQTLRLSSVYIQKLWAKIRKKTNYVLVYRQKMQLQTCC